MNNKLIVDTDIVIDFLKGEENAVSLFRSNSARINFSAITVAEVYAGIRNKKEESQIERFFAAFPVMGTDALVAKIAGQLVNQYRKSHNVEIPDAIIAATCIVTEAGLYTLNIKHYPMFKELKSPYRKS